MRKIVNLTKIKLMEKIRKTDSLSLYKELIENQFLPLEVHKKTQEKKFKKLIEHSYKKVPYYKKIMDELNLSYQTIKLEDLSKFPILEKTIIHKEKENLWAENKDDFMPEKKGTGGSTGQPLRYLLPKNAHTYAWANIWRGWNSGGYEPGEKIAVLAGSSLLSGFDFKRNIYYKLNNWIPMSSFEMDEEKMKKYVEIIKKKKIRFMYGYASSIYELACYVHKKEIKNIPLESVVTTSEMLLPKYREMIEKAFTCKVYNQYGANDGGVSGFECEYHDGLHIGMERCIVEIVDEDGNPLEHGKEGRILLTDLENYPMPFIRYDVGDLGILDENPCKCGRGLLKISELKGRKQEFVLTNENKKIHGELFSHIFRNVNDIEQFQVVQKEKGKLFIKIKYIDNEKINFKKEIKIFEEKIKTKGDFDEIEFKMVEEFEKTKGGKHRFVISQIK